jgi:hypothetical protein
VDSVEQNTTPTVSFTYAQDGVAVNPSPDSATVTVTRADGTALHTNAATTDGGTGIFRYDLSASDTSLLDTLTLEWHIGTQTFTTTVQVQGGFYFTIAEAKALTELASKSAADIAATRTARRAGLRARHRLHLRPALRAPDAQRRPRHRPAPAEAPAALDPGCQRDARASAARRRRSQRPTTPRPPTASTAPAPGRPARTTWSSATSTAPTSRRSASSARCCCWRRTWLTKGPIDDRATGIPTEGGTIPLLTPGVRGSTFGIPEVDAVVEQYGVRQGIWSLSVTRAENAYFDTAWPGSW